jgi:hypothetical protein
MSTKLLTLASEGNFNDQKLCVAGTLKVNLCSVQTAPNTPALHLHVSQCLLRQSPAASLPWHLLCPRYCCESEAEQLQSAAAMCLGQTCIA